MVTSCFLTLSTRIKVREKKTGKKCRIFLEFSAKVNQFANFENLHVFCNHFTKNYSEFSTEVF